MINGKTSCILALLAIAALNVATASASFVSLGVVDGLNVNGSSGDGVYIVGQYLDANGNPIAMRWNVTDSYPIEELGELPTGEIASEAYAASGDGSVIVGSSQAEDPENAANSVQEAFIWEDGAMTGLGFLEFPSVNYQSVATAVSEDGTVVAGHSSVTDPNNAASSVREAFIWEGGEMTGLGFLSDDGLDYQSESIGISADGLIVVGKALNTDPNNATSSVTEAFIWKAGVMTGLGFLQDDTKDVESEATAASYDGSTVVGTSTTDDPNNANKSARQAFIWQDGVMTGLGFLAGSEGPFESTATGVSFDGSIVVGQSKLDLEKEAYIWTAESSEMRSLRSILEEDLGIDLTGWLFDQPPLISADGGVLLALGTNPEGELEAFVSYVPEPAGGIYAGIAFLAWLGRRRSSRLKRAGAS
jgi:probable HAF family extracellular repeat protein